MLFLRVRTADTAVTVFGALYTGFLLAYLVLIIRVYAAGTLLAFTVVLSVWANDSLAYLVGSLIGRHKMAPRISPKKSWEGFVAGLDRHARRLAGACPLSTRSSSRNQPAAGLTHAVGGCDRCRRGARGHHRRPRRVAHEA